MEQKTVKICPQCRRKNPSSLSHCADCGTDISCVAAKADGVGVSMFGTMPIESDVVPLENRSATVYASRYGALQHSPSKEAASEKVESSIAAACTLPAKKAIKKPWD